MNQNVPNCESSLLLQLPKSVLSFSDMSGNSFLLPVAVENVVETEINQKDNTSSSEKSVQHANATEPTSVCQLQQPLLMRRGSSPGPRMAVPYSESNTQKTNVDSLPAGISYSSSPLQPTISNISNLNESSESVTWSNLSTGQFQQSNVIYTSFQNQSSSGLVNQSTSSFPSSLKQENANLGYQNIYSAESSVSSSNNYPSNVPVMAPTFSDFSEKASDYQTATSASDYYSQPPVITPSNPPAYYNLGGRNISQVPSTALSNQSHQNYNVQNPNNVNSAMYTRIYEPVKPYWLFKDIVEAKEIWCGFSQEDSNKLEMSFQQDHEAVVPVDGGRYDAFLAERKKKPVYFEAKDLQIRRCSWFFKSDITQRFTPFSEDTSDVLELHYSNCVTSGQWPTRINVPGVGSICLEAPHVLFYYKNEVELWPTLPDSKASPRSIKRGLPENFEIMCSENDHIDHLVFIVQGIGSFCDLRFRTVAECVDGFRDISNKLLSSHFKYEVESGKVGRVEFLPVAWHAKLHTSDQGFDRCMQNITLPSIPKLRHFTNDTLLDILLYSSPFYCQTIIDTVASELNKLYETFLKRNPGFSGKVFVAGHSLGSLILFDILSHQNPNDISSMVSKELNFDKEAKSITEDGNNVISEENETYDSIASLLQACHLEEYTELFEKEKIDLNSVRHLTDDDLNKIGLPTDPCKMLINIVNSGKKVKNLPETENNASEMTFNISSHDQNNYNASSDSESLVFPFKISPCMSSIVYPRLQFKPACFFALGSPISMFLTVRGYDRICEDFRFPTCPNFFHIFHPYDPVAFRIEPLIDPNFSVKPVLIPHHKGRKRMHLEIRENLSKVGSEIKQKVLETLRYTWNSLSGFAKAFPSAAVEAEVDKLVIEQMATSEFDHQAPSEVSGEEIQIGSLNDGRRIDYVLQEKPIEALNDYIFALTSHSTYWDSEDTVLMILREIYASQGILVSSQSVLENKQISHTDQLPYCAYAQLNTVMSNPCIYESAKVEQIPTNATPVYNQSISPVLPASSQSLHSLNNFTAAAPQTSNVPPLMTIIQQSLGPPPVNTIHQPLGLPPVTTIQQSLGPPPATTIQQPLGTPPATTVQQPLGPPPVTTVQQPLGPPPVTTVQQPLGPPPATTVQQSLGPPPLTGFVKRSPFAR